MSPNIYRIIETEYERRRQKAYETLESRKSEVYTRVPRISDIEDEIQHIGVSYNKMLLLGTHRPNGILTEMLSKIDKLEKEKSQLLTGTGYPGDYLDPAFQCPLCKDTGFIEAVDGSKKCSCYKQLFINLLHEHSGIRFSDCADFSEFNEQYYPDLADESRYGIRKSPRRHIQSIKEKCLRFIENFSSPDEKNLYFYGPTGVGKTFMASCIASELIKMGVTVLYITAPALFDLISSYRSKMFRNEEYEDSAYRSIFTVELLIIDDLGTEPPSAARYAELLNILDSRHSNTMSKPCKTIISTNIPPEKILEYYTERVASRIIGSFALFKLAGDDIRTLKRLESEVSQLSSQ